MSIIDRSREVADPVKALGNTDLYRNAYDLGGEIITLTRGNRSLTGKVTRLQKVLDIAQPLNIRDPLWFAPDDKVHLCSRCLEPEKEMLHLTVHPHVPDGKRYDSRMPEFLRRSMI